MISTPHAVMPAPTHLWDIPSILHQTKWRCGIFNFGKAQTNGVDYFNCSVTDRADGTWLVVRRSQWKERSDFGVNDLMAFKLDGTIPTYGVKVKMDVRFPDGEHFEDPRVIYHDGRTFVSCCDFYMNKKGWSGAHQIMCEVDKDWNCIKRHDPVYGFNGLDVGMNTGHEKNWLWFFHGDEPHLVYQASPHEVVKATSSFSQNRYHEAEISEWDSTIWKYGAIRGGTPPVLRDGEYWTLFHSSTPWVKPKRQYHMGAYAFEAKPPFRITKITTEPLLTGSHHDRFFIGKPPCVFPCGAVARGPNWFVTMGVNDLDCGWIEIPHGELLERMSEV